MNRTELKEVLTQLTQNAMLKIFAKNQNTINRTPSSRRRTRPKFIIKYGPPASGKGSAAVTASIEQLGDKINTYININVDDVVESTNLFRKQSRLLLNKLVANKGINATQPGAVNAIVNVLNHLPAAEVDRKSTRLNSSHVSESRMPSSA